ncbi:MAG: hypothetical protein E6288_21430, partial [Enterobacteriaceae bacterium]|nr:hypothetical protein [Enterobacteriaceae bacterium]
PAACGRFDSTSCLDKPQSAIPGGLTLSSGLRLTNFSGDSTPSLYALRQGEQRCRYGCHAGKRISRG